MSAILLLTSCSSAQTNEQNQQMKGEIAEYVIPCIDTVLFDISSVDYIEYLDDESGYIFNYRVNDTINLDVFTSIIEGDFLLTYVDCYHLYKHHHAEEDTTDLQWYLMDNSHLEYIDNEYFKGYIWCYDAAPIYRFE